MILKASRIDTGSEYTSNEFEEYYKNDILHKKMEPSTPHYSGVTERMNMIVVEKMRSILRMSKFPNTI